MSGNGGGGGAIGRREVAVRCYAAEYDDASLEYSESDEERAPNYVVTPTGARINRLFVVGVLTEVESVSDDVLRGRVVDPTGAFVVYAGQYQPEAKTALERAEPPAFVAVTGKARTFEPDDADRVYTSIRPESINVVDADTRDRWTVQTAKQTIDRVAAFAASLEREERGQALTEALLASGVDPALASGIPRAMDHYGTTEAYLAAVRELALQAAGVVADERDEVESLDLAPGEGGPVEADLTGDLAIQAVGASSGGQSAGETGATTPSGASIDSEDGSATVTADASEGPGAPASTETRSESTESEVEQGADGSETAEVGPEATDDDLGDFDDGAEAVEATGETEATVGNGADGPAADDEQPTGADELYEMDEEERAAVEEEFGTEFSTGSEVDAPGEADIETPGAEEEGGGETAGSEASAEGATEDAESVSEAAPAAPEEEASAPGDEAGIETATAEGQTEGDEVDESDEGDASEAEDEATEADGVDLVDAVVAAMAALDDGAGAERSAVVESVAAEQGVDEGAVEEAIQDALMGGRCYEPDDEHVKAI